MAATIDPYKRLREDARKGLKFTVWTLVINALLAAVKVLGGVLGHSYALIADGVESMLDIMSSIVVWGGLRIAMNPPNERYPYGYGKAESLAGMLVAAMLLVAAVGIAIESVREIATPQHAPEAFTLVILVGVVAIKETMYQVLTRIGKKIGSRAMRVDAWQHRSDALTSIMAFIGISIALLMGERYEMADDWAALAACLVIGYNGYRLFRSALRDVLDAAAPRDLEQRVRELSTSVEGVLEIDKCRIRRSGMSHFVDIHVIVDGEMPVSRGHQIGHLVKDTLLETDLRILDVAVHVEGHEELQKKNGE